MHQENKIRRGFIEAMGGINADPKALKEPACTYPACRCIVSTSTSQPEPICPKGLERQ